MISKKLIFKKVTIRWWMEVPLSGAAARTGKER